MRISYKLIYFYLFPLLIIPLQIYLFKVFVDVSGENDTLMKFLDGVVPLDSKAIDAFYAEELNDPKEIEKYIFRVMAIIWAMPVTFMALMPIFICWDIYKKGRDEKKRVQEEMEMMENPLEEPLLNIQDGNEAVN